MWGQVLTAVLPSLIGGIANRADQRSADRRAAQERETALADDANRFVRLRDGAVAAGFNPLTALQYGGTTTGLPGGVGPVLSTSQFWEAGARAATDEWTGAAAQRRETQRLQNRLTELAIEGAEAELRSGVNASGYASSAASGYGSAAALSGGGQTFTAGENRQVRIAGYDVAHMPGYSDTEDVETVYGDLVSWLYGAGRLAVDAWNTWQQSPQKAELSGWISDNLGWVAEPFNSPTAGVSALTPVPITVTPLSHLDYRLPSDVRGTYQAHPEALLDAGRAISTGAAGAWDTAHGYAAVPTPLIINGYDEAAFNRTFGLPGVHY